MFGTKVGFLSGIILASTAEYLLLSRVVVHDISLTLFTTSAFAFEPDVNDRLQLDVQRAIIDIKAADPGIQSFFDNAAGYAVFPSVGKGGVIIGRGADCDLYIADPQSSRQHVRSGALASSRSRGGALTSVIEIWNSAMLYGMTGRNCIQS